MKTTLLAICLSTLALTACSKPNVEANPDHNQTTATENSTTTTAPVTPASATSSASSTPSALPKGDTAETSLDWHGKYKGILPCADCQGIETELELNADKSYELSEKYLGKGDGKEIETKGKFKFDSKNTSLITLDQAGDQRKFLVSENYVAVRDLKGDEIKGALAQHYILKKSP